MTHVLLVGTGYSGVTKRLLAHGYDYSILKDHLTSRDPTKRYKRTVLADLSTREGVLAGLARVPVRPDAVMAIYENYVVAAAWIAEALGVPGMPVTAAQACTDKWLMRQALANATEPVNPDFAIVGSEDDIRAFAATHPFPLMLKPANLVKSLLITKNDSLDELLANYHHMRSVIEEVYATYAPNRTPTILIESFLQGSMHTVAGFADRDGQPHIVGPIVDLQLAREVGYQDNFLYNRQLPSRLSAETQDAIRHTAALGMRTLNMRASPAHIEIILTPDGPRIVEIGARNGGYRERMYDLAHGIDVVQAGLDVVLGKRPQLSASKNQGCAVLELFPHTSGIFSVIAHADEVQALPSCVYFAVKAKPGAKVGKAADGFKRCAIVILHHADASQLQQDLAYVQANATVVTQTL